MNERDEALKELLKRVAGGPAERELKRDLWPGMLRRLARPPLRIPWWDWALAAALLLFLLLFPETIPAVLYQL
ncbi:MAG TPA: hypothetical protein VMV81_13410 [Phycisphaerae bacterium]|nr:hypothetical protein [Phycisphaerae bacterium]